jgi:hypothetical protein
MEQPPDETTNNRKEDWAFSDLIRRAVVAGAGALFMTEEGIRSFLSDLKLPKEAVQFVVNQVAKTKEDLFNVLSRELREFLESTNLADEVQRVLASTSLEISTTVRFVPNQDSVQPRINASVKVNRKEKEKGKKASRKKRSD